MVALTVFLSCEGKGLCVFTKALSRLLNTLHISRRLCERDGMQVGAEDLQFNTEEIWAAEINFLMYWGCVQ